jgi:hypothetical protein
MTCGKRRHINELSAIAAAIRLSGARATPLRVYRCPDCAGWHLTKRRTWTR